MSFVCVCSVALREALPVSFVCGYEGIDRVPELYGLCGPSPRKKSSGVWAARDSTFPIYLNSKAVTGTINGRGQCGAMCGRQACGRTTGSVSSRFALFTPKDAQRRPQSTTAFLTQLAAAAGRR